MGSGNTPSDRQVCETILKMGADNVILNRLNGTVYIAFYRHRGCGRIYVNVCNYLSRKFPGQRVVVFESPQLGKTCHKTRERSPNQRHFKKTSMTATAERLGA